MGLLNLCNLVSQSLIINPFLYTINILSILFLWRTWTNRAIVLITSILFVNLPRLKNCMDLENYNYKSQRKGITWRLTFHALMAVGIVEVDEITRFPEISIFKLWTQIFLIIPDFCKYREFLWLEFSSFVTALEVLIWQMHGFLSSKAANCIENHIGDLVILYRVTVGSY